MKNYIIQICQNVEKVDYQGVEVKSLFQNF